MASLHESVLGSWNDSLHGSLENSWTQIFIAAINLSLHMNTVDLYIYIYILLTMLVWIGLVDIRSNITCIGYNNSSSVVYAVWNKSLGGGVCVSGQGWPCVCVYVCVCACTPHTVVYWLAFIHVSRAVWLNSYGLRTLGANGSVDKKSSLLPQIRRLNAALRASAARRANGSENTTLRELWHNPHVTEGPRGNVWAKWLLFKSHCMSLAFKYIRVIQGLLGVLLTWYLNWKVNPAAAWDSWL